MKARDVLSLSQFDSTSISHLFQETDRIISLHEAGKAIPHGLNGRIIALLFFEPSSRTFGSFSSAVKRLGGATIEIHDSKNLSASKGESFHDTIKTFESYSDGLIIRHPLIGSVARAAGIAEIPVINAGDGIGEHPTQALLDLYTIRKHHKRLDNLKVVVGGDLLNGRTVHSLLKGLSMHKGNEIYLLAPSELRLESELETEFTKAGLKLHTIESEDDIPGDADIWYWTRVQKERFVKEDDYEKVKNRFIVTPELMEKKAQKDMILMHPLPRVGEITEDVDTDPRAVYFEQMRNGLFLRMALLNSVFSNA